jgi:hypothetical protein
MNTILVWVLVTVGGYNSNQVVYSPPMHDQATCEFLQKNMPETHGTIRSKCVQIRMVVTK